LHPRLLLFVTGVALVVVFVARAGVEQVIDHIARAGAKSLLLFVPYLIGTAVGAFPWAWLLPSEERPSTWALIQGRLAASTANALLPFFGIGGEPTRLLWLAPCARDRGLAAIVVDRILYNGASAGLLLIGAVIAVVATPLPRALVGLAIAAGLVTVLVTVLAFWVTARFGIGTLVHKLVRRFLRGEAVGEDFGRRVDAALLSLVRAPSQRLAAGAGVHLVSRVILAAETWVGLACLGVDATLAQAVVLAVVPIALSLLFSSVPSQIGIQEGAQTLVAGALGLSPVAVLSFVLLQRFRQLALAGLLPVLLVVAKAPAVQRRSVNAP
jgi:hypothetical protein